MKQESLDEQLLETPDTKQLQYEYKANSNVILTGENSSPLLERTSHKEHSLKMEESAQKTEGVLANFFSSLLTKKAPTQSHKKQRAESKEPTQKSGGILANFFDSSRAKKVI